MIWFWNFITYSFLGFLLEVAFAKATHSRPNRKCLLVLPLCPVYGLGACGILLLPGWVTANPLLLFLLGGITATGAEYLAALFYEEVLGVAFWDYHGVPGSLQGRVCLPFSLAWGLLALPLVYVLQPRLAELLVLIPAPITWMAAATAAVDGLLSCVLLKRSGTTACLNWYAS